MYHDVLMTVNRRSQSRFILRVVILSLRKQKFPQDLLVTEIFTPIEKAFH